MPRKNKFPQNQIKFQMSQRKIQIPYISINSTEFKWTKSIFVKRCRHNTIQTCNFSK